MKSSDFQGSIFAGDFASSANVTVAGRISAAAVNSVATSIPASIQRFRIIAILISIEKSFEHAPPKSQTCRRTA
jgi:hypothetical protein